MINDEDCGEILADALFFDELAVGRARQLAAAMAERLASLLAEVLAVAGLALVDDSVAADGVAIPVPIAVSIPIPVAISRSGVAISRGIAIAVAIPVSVPVAIPVAISRRGITVTVSRRGITVTIARGIAVAIPFGFGFEPFAGVRGVALVGVGVDVVGFDPTRDDESGGQQGRAAKG
jgi:hypothetical protein